MSRTVPIILGLLFVLVCLGRSEAITYSYTFSETYNYGVASAEMDFKIEGTTLILSLRNTSPVQCLSPYNDKYSSPGISKFGFVLPGVFYSDNSDWILKAFEDKSLKNEIVIGDRWQNQSSIWYRDSGFIFKISYPKGALFNPLVKGTIPGDFSYFTSAEMTFYFKDSIEAKLTSNDFKPFITMGNIGHNIIFDDNDPNQQTITGQRVATPEPGTLLLFGIGLIGIGIILREMF